MAQRILATAIAFLVGLIVLFGAFLPISPLHEARLLLLQWATVLGAFAFILAFLHLIRVHLVRFRRSGAKGVTSLIIILSAVGTTALVLWEFISGEPGGLYGRHLMRDILIPGESTLLALTAVTLLLAGTRAFRVRRQAGAFIFVLVAVLVLLGTVPYLTILGDVAGWIQRVPATAGMRGLVIGVALGTVLAGLRVIFITRAYSDD